MDILLYMLGILILLVGLAVSIALHELGHLLPAKWFGVRVHQYMIGFGKTIWSRKKGETEYGFKMIPLGGYITMSGMYPPKRPGEAPRTATTGFLQGLGDESSETIKKRSKRFEQMSEQARQVSAESIFDGEDHRTFYRLPVWKKIVIMLAGPMMNFVLGVVFLAVLLSGIGISSPSTKVGHISECFVQVQSGQQSAPKACGATDAPTPAAAAGLRVGDRVIEIEGQKIEKWEQLRTIVAANPNVPLRFVVERNGREERLTVTPAAQERAQLDALGQPVKRPDGSIQMEPAGLIGASAANEIQRQPITAVPAYIGNQVGAVVNLFARLPERMVQVWQAAFGNQERDANGPISVVGVGRIAGEIVSLDETPVMQKVGAIISLLASLNIALFVFNLIPLTPLDGGHIAGALYEGAKRSIARMRGRPDPGPVDTARMVPLTFAVVIIFGAMTLLLIYADIVRPVTLFKGG